ncbi:unnamed protein product, partial [Ectocarpus sp. 13 AM-2016]
CLYNGAVFATVVSLFRRYNITWTVHFQPLLLVCAHQQLSARLCSALEGPLQECPRAICDIASLYILAKGIYLNRSRFWRWNEGVESSLSYTGVRHSLSNVNDRSFSLVTMALAGVPPLPALTITSW